MALHIYSYILHNKGVIDDTAFEAISAAGVIDPDASITAVAAGSGLDLDAVCNQASKHYQEVWKIDSEALSYPDAEVIRRLLVRIIPKGDIVLIPHEHFGMDLAPGLSVMLDAAYLSDAVDFGGIGDGRLSAIRQEFNGQVNTQVECDISNGAVITIRPGSFKGDEGQCANGPIVDKTSEAMEGGIPAVGRRFLKFVEAEVGEIDITQSEVLVSVGRGIADEDNLEIAFDLAKVMGGDVSCSRPIVDAKWLEKERQVGNSGKTVKPKVYLALGISGAFQHLAGLKGNPFVVAVNKNPKAPIFQAADVGVIADILDFIPELTDKINEIKR
ncbi:MAG: electron transfer flavoprotein subunit alpha/FixB family protein [Deltaproteobacteria bacterium]|nr:electron transfer flavoprotein subunit alpha/FixB family protein [Deltaproteobacteria bacterium]MBW2053342.1 electron transfer flavoprotein subunit alpha/FixB family protein [Deltaproteobacteria bacterium]MBW2141014.1 electron transfer flavoprotein subunit alpha/FixB family protein [Deltaproteobacteria bacterium]MBW2322794.1 electron transfer flavoprotein subunit alpha/FixB family protein [Deltaproteobacteria bacterium]